nr:ABC transporter substrate-binding protein [Cupriavidus oxalaticus]
MSNASARAAALEKGEAQYAPFNPVPQRLAQLPSLKLETRGYDWLSPWLFVDVDVDRPYFKDVRVRQALAHAIDQRSPDQQICRKKPAGRTQAPRSHHPFATFRYIFDAAMQPVGKPMTPRASSCFIGVAA